MASAISQKSAGIVAQHLESPVISWRAGEGSLFRVGAFKIEGAEAHEFRLLEVGNKDIPKAAEKIRTIGVCVQQWTHRKDNKHQIVKMFTTEGKKETYFVATDLIHKEIEVYREKLNNAQWEQRLRNEEPNLDRSFLPKHFSTYYLPTDITWVKTRTDQPETWIKSHEKSEIGIIRRDVATRVEFFDEVIHAIYANIMGNNRSNMWNVAQIIKKTRIGLPSFPNQKIINQVIMILDINKCNRTMMLDSPVQRFDFDEKKKEIRLTEINPDGGDGETTAYPLDKIIAEQDVNLRGQDFCTFIPMEQDYVEFMQGQDLALVPHEDIVAYVQKTCLRHRNGDKLVSASFSNEYITVTKEVHKFYNGIYLPAIHIRLNQSVLKTKFKSAMAFLPSITDKARQDDIKYYGTRISEDVIKFALLKPGAEAPDAGFQELDKAFARCSTVDAYLSINRFCGEVEADQELYVGYKLRQSIDPEGKVVKTISRAVQAMTTRAPQVANAGNNV